LRTCLGPTLRSTHKVGYRARELDPDANAHRRRGRAAVEVSRGRGRGEFRLAAARCPPLHGGRQRHRGAASPRQSIHHGLGGTRGGRCKRCRRAMSCRGAGSTRCSRWLGRPEAPAAGASRDLRQLWWPSTRSRSSCTGSPYPAGYASIAAVISADMDAVGQCSPGAAPDSEPFRSRQPWPPDGTERSRQG